MLWILSLNGLEVVLVRLKDVLNSSMCGPVESGRGKRCDVRMLDGRILRKNLGKRAELLEQLRVGFEGAWSNGVEK
jgi:hypothetical protein